MKRLQLRRKQIKKRRYRFFLILFLIISIFIAVSIFQSNRNFEKNKQKAFPIGTVEETLASEVHNNTEVKKVYLPEHGNISYEVDGEGEVVVLLHCWAGARQYWKYTIRDLLPHYRVYALDLKGFGESDIPKSGYQMTDFVDMLHDFFDALGITKAVLVGHSMGGTIALLFTLDYPEYITKLVLVALPMSEHEIGHKLIGAPVIGGLWYRVVRFLGARSLREPKAREIWLKPTVASATQSMNSFVKANPLMRIHEINCPVLLILGKNDPAAAFAHPTTDDTPRFDIKLAIIDAARHAPHCENPAEFNKKLLAFLQADTSELIIPARIR
jgi:pimeloyl-ACP methyl ester carboxylesterase